MPRLAWTLEEFEKLSELGFFGGVDSERERLELIDGELVPMHAKGGRHEWVRMEILNYLTRKLPEEFRLLVEPGWRPGGERYLEPDFVLCKSGSSPTQVPPSEVLLVIEVADTSLRFDAKTKASIYARLGVEEYWVVNDKSLETTVHREPQVDAYGSAVVVRQNEALRPAALPELSIRLADLKLD